MLSPSVYLFFSVCGLLFTIRTVSNEYFFLFFYRFSLISSVFSPYLCGVRQIVHPFFGIMKHYVLIFFFVVTCLASCRNDGVQQEVSCAMYYWRTTLRLSSEEYEFLQRHHVQRLYMRYFDVVPDATGRPVPNATLYVQQSVNKDVEVVPVVYVLNECMEQQDTLLADRLLRRVMQMHETHQMGALHEMQVDCDWTMRTRRHFFAMMRRLHRLCKGRNIRLSATIRLHQLRQPVPPVDCGVLMVYNTGDVRQLSVEHPIIDAADVKPYLSALPQYDLPLSAAYPIFGWRLLFREGRFVGFLHADNDLPILPGDSVVRRVPSAQMIRQVQAMVGEARPSIHHHIILYDLSKDNIQRYKSQDYEYFFQAH